MMQDGSHLDEATIAAESMVLGKAASFSMAQMVRLEVGQSIVNLLHQLHEGGREALFMPSQATSAILQHLQNSVWASFCFVLVCYIACKKVFKAYWTQLSPLGTNSCELWTAWMRFVWP